MFRAGNQIWLRTPACLAAYLFLELSFLIFVVRHQLFENLEKEPNLVEDAGMPGSSVISWTIIVQKHQSGLIWVSFKFNQQTTIIKEKKTDWTWQVCKIKCKQNKTKKWKHKSVSHTHTQNYKYAGRKRIMKRQMRRSKSMRRTRRKRRKAGGYKERI